MKNFSLRQLRIFEATARLGKLNLSAQEHAITQSAASQALKELESQLGYPLFQRLGRELRITPIGQELIPKVRKILSLSSGLTEPMNKVVGKLHIAASSTIGTYILPEILARFKLDYPEVELKLYIGNSHQVIQALTYGDAYVGLIEGPIQHQNIHVRPWQVDQLCIFGAPTHPLTHFKRVTLEQLNRQAWILREIGSGTRSVFDRISTINNIQPESILELNQTEAIKSFVKSGAGIGCLSKWAISSELKSGELKHIESTLDFTRQLSILNIIDNPLNYTTQFFIDSISDKANKNNIDLW